jgi:hypothetical protein
MIGMGTPSIQSKMLRPMISSYRQGLTRLRRSTFSS